MVRCIRSELAIFIVSILYFTKNEINMELFELLHFDKMTILNFLLNFETSNFKYWLGVIFNVD
jgi:hypothetical protein